MIDAFIDERVAVVLVIIKSYYFAYVQMLEDIHIRRSRVTISVNAIALVNWSHECHELSWNDPVQVTILNLLVVLVFFGIEGFEVIPTESDTFLETL